MLHDSRMLAFVYITHQRDALCLHNTCVHEKDTLMQAQLSTAIYFPTGTGHRVENRYQIIIFTFGSRKVHHFAGRSHHAGSTCQPHTNHMQDTTECNPRCSNITRHIGVSSVFTSHHECNKQEQEHTPLTCASTNADNLGDCHRHALA